MNCSTDSVQPATAPPLLTALNPAPGRFKPRGRLLSIRTRRSPRMCVKNIDPERIIPTSLASPTEPSQTVVEPDVTTVPGKCTQPIRNFMKRFSVRFSPMATISAAAASTESEIEPAERIIKRNSNRFSFNSWRRRKTLSHRENIPDRDRSPLKAAQMALDEQWALFQTSDVSSLTTEDENSIPTLPAKTGTNVRVEDKENVLPPPNVVPPWTIKRRSLWNFSLSSLGSTSGSSSVDCAGSIASSSSNNSSSGALPIRLPPTCSPLDMDRTPKPIRTPYPQKRRCARQRCPSLVICQRRRRSTLRPEENLPTGSCDRTQSPSPTQSSEDLEFPTVAGRCSPTVTARRDRTGSVTPTTSHGSSESVASSPTPAAILGQRLTFLASSPTRCVVTKKSNAQHQPQPWHSCDRLSRYSLESNFSHPDWTANKAQSHDSGVSSEVSTSSARTVDSTEITAESDTTDGQIPDVEPPIDTLSSASHSPIHLRRYTTRHSATVKINDAIWNNRLRRSLDRAGRQCRLLAGRTLFNKNPIEGMHYLLDHGLVSPVPVAIARFLLNESDLSRQAIGEYFGTLSDNLASLVLREYIQLLDMKNLEVDEALRVVLSHFHPVGESQKISHLMQTFQEIYTVQNLHRVADNFRSTETIEVLAYSILLLHTDLHNPNVRRVGKRMTRAEFVSNNRGIDADQDLPVDMLNGIYDRVAEAQFKTLPDPFDRLRTLDSLLTGPLKTDNFLQRHRRFVGWAAGHQVDSIMSRRSPKRPHGRWRYFFVFNDILIVAKPVSTGSLLNLAAAAALGEPVSGSASSTLRRKSLPIDRIVEHRLRPRESVEINAKLYHSSEPMTNGTYHVRLVLPLVDLRVLLFETHYHQFGVQLCNATGPILNVNLVSAEARQTLINWLHNSIAEMTELRSYYQMKSEPKTLPTETENHPTVADMETRL